MQANNAKAMSTCQEPQETQGVQTQDPKGWPPQTQSTCLYHSSQACAHIAKGLRLCWPKSKAKIQTRPQAAVTAQVQALARKGAHAPMKAAQWRPMSAIVRTKGLV